jgi:hypothetical protein
MAAQGRHDQNTPYEHPHETPRHTVPIWDESSRTGSSSKLVTTRGKAGLCHRCLALATGYLSIGRCRGHTCHET